MIPENIYSGSLKPVEACTGAEKAEPQDVKGRIPYAELEVFLRVLGVKRTHQTLLWALGLGGVTILGWGNT